MAGASASSIASTKSGSSTTSSALTFSAICSGRLAPDDGGAHVLVLEHPGQGHRGRRVAGLAAQRGVGLHGLEHLVAQQPADLAALGAGGPRAGRRRAAPGRYLPVRTPWARGDQTICPMPSLWHSGTTSASMTRQISEYWGWLDTMRSKPISSAIRSASAICSAVHSDTPT